MFLIQVVGTSQGKPVPSTSHLESEPEDLDSNNSKNDVQVPLLKLKGGNAEDLFKLIRKSFSDFKITLDMQATGLM